MQAQLLWDIDDWNAHRCEAKHLGKPKELWTADDAHRGHCAPTAVGTPRPPDFAQAEALLTKNAALPLTPKQLRKDVLEAYRHLGGVKYLMKNPLLLEKLLAKVVAEDAKVPPTTNVQVNLGWIKPGRLSYRDNLVDLGPALEANKQLEDKLKD